MHEFYHALSHSAISSLRKRSGVAGGIQVKHWQSHFRRNGLFALLCNLLALVSDDMAIVALWPSRHSRGLGSATSFPSVVIDHAAQLQSLGMSLVRSVNAVLHAEQEAFQHLIKDQQVSFSVGIVQYVRSHCIVGALDFIATTSNLLLLHYHHSCATVPHAGGNSS